MKLDYKRTVLVGLAFMTISAFWQLYNNEIPLMLEDLIGKRDFIINIVMTLDNISALVLLPIFGMLSDKTNTRFGKRMPYILIGTVLSVAFMLLIPLAHGKGIVPLFFVGVIGVLLSMSVYRSPAVALMPDVTPKPLRSKGNAIINLMGAVGIIFIGIITPILGGETNYPLLFLCVAAFMMVSLIVMFVTVNENQLVSLMPHEEETEEERNLRDGKGVKMHDSVLKSLIFLLLSVFLWYMAYSAVETNYSRYAEDIWGLVEGEYTKPMLFGSIVALVSFVPLGMLSGKLGRKNTVLLGVGVLFAAIAVTSFITWYTPFLYVIFAFIGISWAAINVNSYPMVVEMSKGADVGKYTGLYYTFSMIAQVLTPLVTGLLFDVLNTRKVLFPYAAVFLLFAFVTMLFVNHGDVHDEMPNTEETPVQAEE